MEDAPHYRFRLYIAGDTPNSMQAMTALSALCDTHLAGRHSIETVDVFESPERALEDGIFLTPMLVKLSPFPLQRIVGTLGERQVVLQTLGLPWAPT